MNAYNVALFIHLLGVITLFIAFGITQRAGVRIRRADTADHLRLWLDLASTTQNMFPAAIILLLGAGLYMTADIWDFTTPWVVVAIITIGVMTVGGIVFVGRGLARLARAAGDQGEGPVSGQLQTEVRRSPAWVALSTLNGAALGVVWLMATKPGWIVSVSVVVGLAVIGGVAGLVAARRN